MKRTTLAAIALAVTAGLGLTGCAGAACVSPVGCACVSASFTWLKMPVSRSANALSMESASPSPITPSFTTTPEQLACFTAIKAPLGLKDALLHVRRKDGVVVTTVEDDEASRHAIDHAHIRAIQDE